MKKSKGKKSHLFKIDLFFNIFSFFLIILHRSLHDSLCVVKRTLETGYVVPGGGACEIALNIKLDDYSKTLGNKEQEAVAEFAEALTVIPKVNIILFFKY